MKESKKIRRFYEKEIERAESINELVWLDTEFRPEIKLSCDDVLDLCRISKLKREKLERMGQTYRRAMKPSWR